MRIRDVVRAYSPEDGELLPCPLCEETPSFVEYYYQEVDTPQYIRRGIMCYNCRMQFAPESDLATFSDLAEKWNSR